MQEQTMILKFIRKTRILFIGLFFITLSSLAQVATIDSTGTVQLVEEKLNQLSTKSTDSVTPFKRYKVEGVTAVVGEYVIVEFDIDMGYQELKAQGIPVEDITRCELMGKLMEDKLYSHHAKIDSIMVSDNEINQEVDQRLNYIVSELGSEEKAAAYYRKENIDQLRQELFDVSKDLKLASEMQRSIVELVEVTPEEVRSFFFDIPEEERPVFSAEVEIAQIVIKPKITEKAKQDAIDKLAEMRADIIENGSSFATKAVLYSKDGTAQKGGLIEGVQRSSPMAKEFKDQAFGLLEGEISEPFETEFGFHLLKVDKVRGQEVDVRHVIIFPEIDDETTELARIKMDSIRTQIELGTISFEDAAKQFSDETETRNNGGQIINPVAGDAKFDLTKMDSELGAQVYNLKEGEVSPVFMDRDFSGKSSFKILTVTKRYEEHPADYVRDYEKIKLLALKEKKIKAIETWQEQKIKETYVNINEDYGACKFVAGWAKN